MEYTFNIGFTHRTYLLLRSTEQTYNNNIMYNNNYVMTTLLCWFREA